MNKQNTKPDVVYRIDVSTNDRCVNETVQQSCTTDVCAYNPIQQSCIRLSVNVMYSELMRVPMNLLTYVKDTE